MMIMILALAACLSLAAPAGAAGQIAGRQLNPLETDRAVDGIFQGAINVNRLEAEISTQKTGGVAMGGQTSFESLRLEAPSRMWLQNRGASERRIPLEDSSLVIVDGRNIWEVEARQAGARERTVSRREFRPKAEGLRGKGLGAFIGMFLLGREVSSASELRQDFDITCLEEAVSFSPEKTLHFILNPRKGGENLELWVFPGRPLPWRIRSFERKIKRFPPPKPGEEPQFRLEETVRVLRNVRTNLDGLPPFQTDVFILPLAADMRIRDEQTNQQLSHEQVRRELAAVRDEYLRDQAMSGRR